MGRLFKPINILTHTIRSYPIDDTDSLGETVITSFWIKIPNKLGLRNLNGAVEIG